jgi:hypothetical protein
MPLFCVTFAMFNTLLTITFVIGEKGRSRRGVREE